MVSHNIVDQAAKTILVVDDEDAARTLICTVLRGGGYSVFEAEDSAAALEIMNRHADVDLLLTDVSMPGQNGCDLAAELHRQRPDLKILFMSGLPGDEVPLLGRNDGHRILQKPFGIGELLARVRQFLGPPNDRQV